MACLEGESEEEMLKERKIKLVDELAEKLEKASTLIVADYRGLSVADFYELRHVFIGSFIILNLSYISFH